MISLGIQGVMALGPVTGLQVPGYGWDRYRYRSTQSHLPKTHTHGLGLAGFPRHPDHKMSHITITLHTITDATTHPGHENTSPRTQQRGGEVGREQHEHNSAMRAGMGHCAHPHKRFVFNLNTL